MRTIVLTNLLIRLLFRFSTVFYKKHLKGIVMDFAIIRQERIDYDLQSLALPKIRGKNSFVSKSLDH